MKKNTPDKAKKYSHLTLAEREELAIGLENGMKQCDIARILKRSPSTISREIKRNNPPINTVRYRAHRAQKRADDRKAQSHKKHRLPHKRLRRYICTMIMTGYSPEIAAVINSRWKTNHETIYQWRVSFFTTNFKFYLT